MDKNIIALKRRDIEKEKARIALHMPHVVAREAAHVYSKRQTERVDALNGLAAGVAADFEMAYTVAFFECIEAWLTDRGYDEAASAAETFARQLYASGPVLHPAFDNRKVQNY